jgi:hypothetical protein
MFKRAQNITNMKKLAAEEFTWEYSELKFNKINLH